MNAKENTFRIPNLELVLDTAKTGSLLRIWATAGSKLTRVTGVNVWRRALEVDVAAPAERGRANEELLAYLAQVLRCRPEAIQLQHGATGRSKTVILHHLPAKAVLGALGRIFGPTGE